MLKDGMKMKKWIINKPDTVKADELTKRTDLQSLCAQVLVSRGMTELDDVVSFFSEDELSDPFLLKDMTEACETIREAIETEQLICVYGDYDCDGVTSTAVLFTYLECNGANVMYYIPERDEGYGLNKAAIKKLSDDGVALILTVDNGISATEEAEYIYELGMKLVITDHHQQLENLPRAEAVVNPHRHDDTSPFKMLCGAGVALKLVAALDDGNYDIVMEQYAEIVAIGTVADVVPLIGENRTIVRRGLSQLMNTENEGLSYLVEKAGVKGDSISAITVAFMIAPRINSAGRFGSPTTALKALISEDEDRHALVDELISLNNQRKKTEDEIYKSIVAQIEADPQMLNERVLVLLGENWHHGVIGIVSSKLIERFGKPNFIISIEGDEARGSARGIKGFDVAKCLAYCADTLEKYGGHPLAGGFSLKADKTDEFRASILQYADENNNSMPQYTLTADKLLTGADIDTAQVEALSRLEPFGEGNPLPLFALIGARIERIVSLSNGRHTRLELTYDKKRITAMLFFRSADSLGVSNGNYVDILANVEINEYNNIKSVVLKVKDIRLSGINQSRYFKARDAYEKVKRGEKLPDEVKNIIIPDRNTLVTVYKSIPDGISDIDGIFAILQNSSINYCKMRLCIDILCELSLLVYLPLTEEIDKKPATKKVDLESSQILKELRCL